MKKYLLKIEFDGTDFNGYQIQKDKRTVQGVMEDALSQITKEKIKIRGCSRTDAGVHGENYYFTFDSSTSIPAEKIPFPLNDILPPDIKVKGAVSVDMDFDIRKNISKTYQYTLKNSSYPPVLLRRGMSHVKLRLDFEKMKKAGKLFVGTHDFKGFMSVGSMVGDTVRTIYALDLVKDGEIITMTIKGDGFLYNMVRIIMGTLIFVGQGTRTLEDVRNAIEKMDRSKAGKVAEARGLTLKDVSFREDFFNDGI